MGGPLLPEYAWVCKKYKNWVMVIDDSIQVKSLHAQPVSIPLTQSNPDRTTKGLLYGSSPLAIVLSNMDTNVQSEWDPLVHSLMSDKYMILTYEYFEHLEDQSNTLDDAISFVGGLGAKNIILIGASRGGVASIKVAARHGKDDRIAGVVALSAPIEYEGTIFYRNDDLREIKIPKFLINSENDDGADDTREMFEIFEGPKELVFCRGSAHGTELFQKERESIIEKLRGFIESVFGE